MTEFDRKQDRMRALLVEHGLDALLLQRVSSFAWATCGAASYVNTAVGKGASSLLIMPSERHLITNNIEAPRLEREEGLSAQGWELHAAPWHEAHDTVAELTRGMKLGADGPYPGAIDLAPELARLRAALTPEEGQRLRKLGRVCADAMAVAARNVQPGQTEHEIAALLAQEAQRRGVQAIVDLVATDERVSAFRHPLPTQKKLDHYAMLVLCGRRQGLVCSITRFVYFGRLPDELRRKAEATARVDGTLIAATRPGEVLGKVFRRGVAAYAEAGFSSEWKLHHQGGPVGYEPREWLAVPDSNDVVSPGQAYAWNPSITGTKSEDTVLVGEDGNEVLTGIDGWPTLTVTAEGEALLRPTVLEVL
jgi:Xaa-Pro aminopeptidase